MRSLRGLPPLLLVAVGVAAASMAVSVGTWLLVAAASPPWQPLGPYPVQAVDQAPGQVHNVNVVTHLQVEGVKCREGTQGVQVEGQLGWVRDVPAGFSSAPLVFPSVVVPNGCQAQQFTNDIPADVVAAVCRLPGVSLWHIAGYENPTGDVLSYDPTPAADHSVVAKQGLRLGWQTETIQLTCEEL